MAKVPSICQFLQIFKGVLRINYTNSDTKESKAICPFDLEQSILRPQFDPLVGDIVSRLLQKNKWKMKETGQAPDADKEDGAPSQNYD